VAYSGLDPSTSGPDKVPGVGLGSTFHPGHGWLPCWDAAMVGREIVSPHCPKGVLETPRSWQGNLHLQTVTSNTACLDGKWVHTVMRISEMSCEP
jgi:hypothetical protein